MFTKALLLSLIFNLAESKMEGKVSKGSPIDISALAHSTFLQITDSATSYICGSSIINQMILLTAAHCVANCLEGGCHDSFAFTGNSKKTKGVKHKLAGFITHENYRHSRVDADIGLVALVTPLELGPLAKRVAIGLKPPLKDTAVVAGWGLINEEKKTPTDYLHYTNVKVISFQKCRTIISSLPRGCLCTGQMGDQQYASAGDSGSALVVNKYFQIGLVSYKRPDISPSIVVFTNVSYYFDWIKKYSKILYCTKFRK